ncbi:MAG: hypothetical protein CM15mP45_12420 [Deltaproteobacteria bacterium]|nr:MAG: hypothetical protein CM15mP45_12420 [Deltaproteobacteria bacterium]
MVASTSDNITVAGDTVKGVDHRRAIFELQIQVSRQRLLTLR